MERFRLLVDNDGHHYVVPVKSEDDFYAYINAEGDIPLPDSVIEVGGSTSLVSFEKPEIE